MAEIPAIVKETINKYLAALRDNNIPIKQAVLFGSYANGNYNDWSDIEVLPYNPKYFTIDDPFVKEILETGVKIVWSSIFTID